jgi:hypothetical protein
MMTALLLASLLARAMASPPTVAAARVATGGSSSAAALASIDDVHENLSHLASADGAERVRAQRWLTANLSAPRDVALLVAAARGGDSEVRGRIEEALADDDRHLDLAAALACEVDAAVADVGRGAIAEMVERWSPGSKRIGKIGPPVFSALREGRERPIEIDESFSTRPLEDVLALLARYAPRAPEIAIDPTVAVAAPNTRRKGQTFAGPFDRLLQELLAARGLECEGFGLGDDKPAGAITWLCVVSRGRDAARSAADIVVNWCVASRQPGDEALRSSASRALAATAWPAANAWLARRWTNERDLAALDGLALAAEQNGVPPVLAAPSEQAELRRVLDLALARDDAAIARGGAGGARASGPMSSETQDARRAWSVANLLGATGVTGPRGEDLGVAALEGSGTLSGRALWLRLVELEGRRSTAPEVAAALDAWIAREDLAPALRLEALRVRRLAGSGAASQPDLASTVPDKPPAITASPIARLDALVEWAASARRLDELANILRARPGSVPDSWRDPVALPSTWGGLPRAIAVEGWLVRGDLDAAAAHLAQIAVNGDGPAREAAWIRLRNFAEGDVERVIDAAFVRALALPGANTSRLLRGAAIAGAASSDEMAKRAFESVSTDSAEPLREREDLLALGALSAGPRGPRARAALVKASTASGSPQDRLDALDRAVLEIRGVRDRSLEQAFLREVRAAAREAEPAWRAKVRVDVWPTPPPRDPLRLADFDRSFARAGI